MKLTDEDRQRYQKIVDSARSDPQNGALLMEFVAELCYTAGFQSGMERAAKVCDTKARSNYFGSDSSWPQCAEVLAKTIRRAAK